MRPDRFALFGLPILASWLGLWPALDAQACDRTSRIVLLTLPRKPEAAEAVNARLLIGALPEGTKVVVRSKQGDILGTISPFGSRPGQKASTYLIPVPEKVFEGEEVTLRLQVCRKGEDPRAPTREEVESTTLILVPVTSK